MNQTTSERNQEVAYGLSNNLARLLREFGRDYERRIWQQLAIKGYPDIRPAHSAVFANLGMGAVRVTELAERAQVTQQAMGKMLKELERMGYVCRDVDGEDKRARSISLTDKGVALAVDSLAVVRDVRSHYDQKIGTERLAELETKLREALGLIDLEYLPESWADPEWDSSN